MADEVQKAQESPQKGDTVFGKMLKGDIPVNFIYQDEQCVAFHDISPQAPTHFLVIPRKPIPSMMEVTAEDAALLGHLVYAAKKVAEDLKLDKGYRIVINNGPDGAQAVYHLHLHVMGGRQLGWPPG